MAAHMSTPPAEPSPHAWVRQLAANWLYRGDPGCIYAAVAKARE